MPFYANQNVHENAQNMHKYAVAPEVLYAWICKKYAQICKIRKHKSHMQNMQNYALPALLMAIMNFQSVIGRRRRSSKPARQHSLSFVPRPGRRLPRQQLGASAPRTRTRLTRRGPRCAVESGNALESGNAFPLQFIACEFRRQTRIYSGRQATGTAMRSEPPHTRSHMRARAGRLTAPGRVCAARPADHSAALPTSTATSQIRACQISASRADRR